MKTRNSEKSVINSKYKNKWIESFKIGTSYLLLKTIPAITRILQLYLYVTAFMIIGHLAKYNIFIWQKKGTSFELCKIYIYSISWWLFYPSELIAEPGFKEAFKATIKIESLIIES